MTSSTSANPANESEVLKTFNEYLLASFSLDAKRVATYYDEPFMVVTPGGSLAIASRADVEAFLSPGFKDLQQAGYAKTEFPELKSRSLGNGLEVISGRGVRIKADGTELATFGLTYIWREHPDGWKMTVMTVHDPKKLLPLD